MDRDRLSHWFWPENSRVTYQVMSLEKVETAVRLGVQSRFAVMGFAHVAPFGACALLVLHSCQLEGEQKRSEA